MKNILFLLSFMFINSINIVYANDNIDYDKPFDEIKNNISDFSARHSLMPENMEKEAADNKRQKYIQNNTNVIKSDTVIKESKQQKSSNTIKLKKPIKKDFINSSTKIKFLDPDLINETYRNKNKENNELLKEYNNIKKQIKNLRSSKIIKPTSEKKKEIPVKQPQKKINNPNIPVKSQIIYSNTANNIAKLQIASYKDETSTYKGIKILKGLYDKNNRFDTVVNYENIKGKGWYYRVYFTGDKDRLIDLCDDIKRNGDWCNLKE